MIWLFMIIPLALFLVVGVFIDIKNKKKLDLNRQNRDIANPYQAEADAERSRYDDLNSGQNHFL